MSKETDEMMKLAFDGLDTALNAMEHLGPGDLSLQRALDFRNYLVMMEANVARLIAERIK